MIDGPMEAPAFAQLYQVFRERHRDRDERMALLDAVVSGDWTVVDPDNEALKSRSPNLIQVALEDTAEAASAMPTVRVTPRKNTNALKDIAGRMERIAAGYFDHSTMDLLVPQTVMDMGAFGFGCWVVWPDMEERLPIIEKRDPRHCYPEPGLRPGSAVRRCMFSRVVQYEELPEDYKATIQDFVTDTRGQLMPERMKINLVELFTEHDVTIACMFDIGHQPNSLQLSQTPAQGASEYIPVIVDYFKHDLGACPVVIGSRFTLDGEFRGQFDQVVGVQEGLVRLMAMVLDYADQSVYSDVWVKDLIGELSWGGGAYIELGPQGAIGRVAPAVSSLNVQNDMDRLVDGIHVGGRWPKSRPGEIDQAIASAKFVEATAGMLNTAIKTYHQLLQRMMEHAVRLSFQVDLKFFPEKKTVSAVLRNQEFVEEYDPTKDIDLKNRIRIEYGVGLGRDPAQSGVLMIQYAKEGYISNEWVQENIEGLTDVARERVRIDTEKMEAMLMAALLQGVQEKSIDPAALPQMIEARAKGESLSSLYQKYIVTSAQQPGPPGLPPGAPGAPPGMQGGAPGQAPPPPAGVVPPAPGADALMSRLGVPAGNRQSFMSVSS